MTECVICYDVFIETSTYCITNCNHSFCINCLNTLMSADRLLISIKRHTNCPYCRNKISQIKFHNIKNYNKLNNKDSRIMSDSLCALLDLQNGSVLSFSDINRGINKYIIQNNLWDKSNNIVTLDDKLTLIIHPSLNTQTQQLYMWNIPKYTKHNYSIDIRAYNSD